jgi:hypothetical protein
MVVISNFMSFGSINNKMLLEVSKMENVSNISTINVNGPKLLSFNVSCYDKSNELHHIFLRSIDELPIDNEAL